MNYTVPYASAVPHIILVPPSVQIPLLFYAVSIAIQVSFALFAATLFVLTLVFRCRGSDILSQQHSQADSVSNDQTAQKRKDLICFGDIDHQVNSEQEKSVKSITNNEQQASPHQKKQRILANKQLQQYKTFGQSFWNMTTGGLSGYGFGNRKKQENDPAHEIFVQTAVRKFVHQAQYKNNRQSNFRVTERRLIYLFSFFGILAINVNSFDSSVIGISALAAQILIFISFNICKAQRIWKITLLLYFLPSIVSFYEFLQGSHQLYVLHRIT